MFGKKKEEKEENSLGFKDNLLLLTLVNEQLKDESLSPEDRAGILEQADVIKRDMLRQMKRGTVKIIKTGLVVVAVVVIAGIAYTYVMGENSDEIDETEEQDVSSETETE